MNAVIMTIHEEIGSERLGNWLEVTELLSGRVGILTQRSGLGPALFCGQISGPGLTTMVLGKYTHWIHRKSLNTFFFLYWAFQKYKEESLDCR